MSKLTREVINTLMELGVFVFVENGKLKTRAPKSAMTDCAVDLIKSNKDDLIEYLSHQDGEVLEVIPVVTRNPDGDLLSFTQQRLWLVDQLEQGSSQYNIPAVLRLSGDLNIVALTDALTTIIMRHESLRSVIFSRDGEPLQIVNDAREFELSVIDLSALNAVEKDKKIPVLVENEASQAFDLSRDLMLRGRLLVLSEDEHMLLLTMHHIASDAWSAGIFIRELSILYKSYVQGRGNPLTPLPVQYADYSHWQRNWLQGDILDKKVNYWREQLAGLPLLHSFPLDYARPALQSVTGDNLYRKLDHLTLKKLATLCEQEGATLFMGLHAAFSVLLARYSGETDIVMGSPIANREQDEVSQLIGFFANTLVLRSDVSGSPSFIDLLNQSKAMTLDAYAHQQMPFEQIVEVLQPERSLAHSPLFQIMLVLHNNEKSELSLPGLTLSPVNQAGTQSKFDLTLNVQETQDGLVLEWEYNTDLFKASTIASVADHFVLLCENIISSPKENVYALPMVNAAEIHQFLVEWNDTQVAYPDHLCIHELFEQQTDKNPSAIALAFEDQQLTYRELNDQANQLAYYLVQEKHSQPDTLVGVCLDRSLNMVIAVLAILKAGGAYVPLDPDYPEERLAFMLNDAEVATVITTNDILNDTPISSEQALCLDDIGIQKILLGLPASNIPCHNIGLTPKHLAYVIYTSGSTGKPKGVMIEHRNTVAFISWGKSQFRPAELRGVLASTSLNFDLSVFELFLPLAVGGSICLVKNALDLLSDSGERTITLINTVPSVIKTLLAHNAIPETVSTINLAGELLKQEVVEALYAHKHVTDVYDLYGPSEDTTYSTYCRRVAGGKSSIGKPIHNTQAYVLDAGENLTPLGVEGELHVSGAGLARGYLNRPELTEEKFIACPFNDNGFGVGNTRLYKTGDLVRWLPDGNLEYLGRIDDQVKIRGFRIELGEIENILNRHDDVSETVVVAREDASGDQRLVAYVVSAIDFEVSSESNTLDNSEFIAYLRGHLSETLPEYMQPSAFVFLPELPLTPNGKIDRLSLPPPDLNQYQKVYVEPHSNTEKIMCVIWQDLLGLDQVGITNNFFHFGGHSLLAVRLVAQLEARLEVVIPVRAVFEYSTLEALAEYVDHTQHKGLKPLPAISPRSASHKIPLSLVQQSYWFLYQLEEGGAMYNVAATLCLKGKVDIAALESAFNAVVARHENLRTRLVRDGKGAYQNGTYQAIDQVSSWRLSQVDTDESEVQSLVQEYERKAFVLEQEVAFKARLFCVGEQNYALSIVSHHSAIDGWSMDILIKEISQFYNAFCLGIEDPLQPLSIQYGDYAVWQQEHIRGERYDFQCSYWKEQLSGLAPLLNLPTDYIRPSVQSYRGDSCPIEIPKPLSNELSLYAQSQGVTLFHVLLGGMAVLLSRYARTTDIPIGTAIANRPQQALEELIGCFANTVVLRCNVSRDHNFTTLVRAVRDTALDAFSHSDIPFDGVVESVQPERSLGVPPIFQVMFRLNNQAQGEGLNFQDVTIEPFPFLSRETVELDLNISLVETPDGIKGRFSYVTDLFKSTTIERFIQHYIKILTEALKEPSKPISTLALLSNEETQQLEHWNDTAVAYPQNECIHTLFEKNAIKFPQKIAYVCGNDAYSYQKLNDKANQIAHFLRRLGVGPEVRVGVCVGRSMRMGISMLAILKSGGTYVPIDPAYPKVRLGHILDVAKPKFILTEKGLIDLLPDNPAKTFCFDSDAALWEEESWKEESKENPVPIIGADHSAYILFTSGTTGKPKGILVAHKSLRNMPVAHDQWGLLNKDARILQFASFSFSISIWGSFMAWAAGSTLYQVTDEESHSGEALYQLLNDAQISLVTWPVSLLSVLPLKAMPDSLKTVISSAEPCNERVVERWVSTGRRFLNLYGNSEVSIGSTLYEYKEVGQKLTIGRALPNTQMYLLDEQLQPVPVGVVAEIYTAGVGLAKGYVDNPEDTRKQFIQHAVSSNSESRVYKTGDFGRYLANGEIEFVGREDSQVSVRGFRVELSGIENVVISHPGISSAVVVVRSGIDGIESLVCFYTPKEGCTKLAASDLNKFVGKKLPNYMVPSLFVEMANMPMTPNKKIDRLALQIPDTVILSGEGYTAPQTETEFRLCDFWRDVLALDRVGVSDDFFHIGGHSLLALRLIERINQFYGHNFPVTALFHSPTVSEFSNVVNAIFEETQGTCLRLMKKCSSTELSAEFPTRLPIFIVPGIGGSLLNLFDLSNELSLMGSVYGLQAVGLDDELAPLRSVEEISRVNIEAIQSVQSEGPYRLVGHSFGGWIVFEMARQLKSLGRGVSIVLLDSPPPTQETNSHRLAYAQGENLEEIDTLVDGLMGGQSVYKAGLSLIERELKERIQTIARIQASIIYCPDTLLTDVDVLYFRAWDQMQGYSESALQWSSLFTREISYQNVSYDHFGMLERESAKEILKLMQSHFSALNLLESDEP